MCYNERMNTNVKMIGSGAAVILLMAGSFATGRLFVPAPAAALDLQGRAEAAPRAECVTVSADALKLAQVLSEVDALKAEKAALQQTLAALEAAQARAEEVKAQEPPPRRSMRERMEELKQRDPDRYRELEERRAQMHQAMQEARERRDDFLGNIDLSLFTPEQRDIHERFTAALAKQAEMEALMHGAMERGEMLSDEQRAAMRETFQRVNQLREEERGALLGAVATSMGLSETETADFTQLLSEIYEVTGMGARMRPGRGQGGPGGGMPPPGP